MRIHESWQIITIISYINYRLLFSVSYLSTFYLFALRPFLHPHRLWEDRSLLSGNVNKTIMPSIEIDGLYSSIPQHSNRYAFFPWKCSPGLGWRFQKDGVALKIPHRHLWSYRQHRPYVTLSIYTYISFSIAKGETKLTFSWHSRKENEEKTMAINHFYTHMDGHGPIHIVRSVG